MAFFADSFDHCASGNNQPCLDVIILCWIALCRKLREHPETGRVVRVA